MNGLLRCAASAAAALSLAGTALADVDLQVDVLDGQESLTVDFGSTQSLRQEGEPASETSVRRVRLRVTSAPSSGRYQVFQQVDGPWTNPEGESLPPDAVQYAVSETMPRGDVRVPNPIPLRTGEEELYLSSAAGENTELIVTYQVRVPPGQQAGRYRTSVTYRVVSQ